MTISELAEKLKDKEILIMGFGREGRSTYLFLRKLFPEKGLAISDQNTAVSNDSLVKTDSNLRFHLGADYLFGIEKYDLVLKTPGISTMVLEDKVSKDNISSQTDLFLQLFASKIVGITGTKGKSTTTFLSFEILKKHFPDVLLAGNMGIPLFDVIEQIHENTIIVCEFSSHQLENITTAPHIAIQLNLYQEHLDHYHSYKQYQLAKYNMVLLQQKNGYAIYNEDNELLRELFTQYPVASQKLSYSIQNVVEQGCYLNNNNIIYKYSGKAEVVFSLETTRVLKGDHNLQNTMAVVAMCKILQVPNQVIQQGISEFKGLEHRMEYVGEKAGISFYNDSISTIPEATMAAVKSLVKVDTLILGGFSRGIDYVPLARFLFESDVRNLVFIGNAGQQILTALKQLGVTKQNYLEESDYTKIVDWCFRVTQKGTICLLSPAASSYDSFKNFEERGTLFKQLVLSHK